MDEFTIRVEVVDADGNVCFGLTVPAVRSELFLPEHGTPGVDMVMARLSEVAKTLEV